MLRLLFWWICCAALAQPPQVEFPLAQGSVRFAVIGDSGTGRPPQYETAAAMTAARQNFPFEFVLMMGDNIYGGHKPADFKAKFEDPYKDLLGAGVKFYASLGNHDRTNEVFYKPFNMGGQRYYSFTCGNAQFFALDSNYLDPQQVQWLRGQLETSKSEWKICFFHHPLYSAAGHGPDVDVRTVLEPLLQKFGVQLVLTGHEHSYQRFAPRGGIVYFVLGNSGQLRSGEVKAVPGLEKKFDTDRAFALMEIAGPRLTFRVISRKGDVVDAGALDRPSGPAGVQK